MQAKQAPIEVTTFDALNQSSPTLVAAALERKSPNKSPITTRRWPISNWKCLAWKTILVLYIKGFTLNTTQDKEGLLARYLELVKTQVALEKKARIQFAGGRRSG